MPRSFFFDFGVDFEDEEFPEELQQDAHDE
jgi:hypothetical protein